VVVDVVVDGESFAAGLCAVLSVGSPCPEAS